MIPETGGLHQPPPTHTVFGARTAQDAKLLGRRGRMNGFFTGLVYASVVIAVVPLVAIVFYVLRKGGSVISVDFLTKDIPILSRSVGPGMGPAIVGTLLITGTATLMAVPLGILAAVYLNEYGKKNRLATVIRTMADVMTGVPSIVMGLFIYTIWVLRYGYSGFAGALALACLMLPIVIRSTEEILRLVPAGLREASLALGASRARHHQRRPAGRGPGGRRDRSPAVHHRGRPPGQRPRLQRRQHRPVHADLPQRPTALRGRPATGLGGGADPHRAGGAAHDPGPDRDQALLGPDPLTAAY